MIETLQLEEAIEVRDTAPRLIVEWSPRWHEFVTSIGPALARSDARLAGEAPFGLVPFRIMIPSYLLEAFLIFCIIIVPIKLAQLRPYVAPRVSSHEVIYYSGDELPRTEDLGGAEAGKTGAAGGEEAHHRTQTIRIARGGSLVQRVVDAPNLKLPPSKEAVANLLAIRPNPGPPPSEGLRSSRTSPTLATSLVAPAPDVIHDYTRNGVSLNAVIAPPPAVSREPLMAPNFSANVVAPAPSVSRDHPLVAPALAPAVVAPAPNVSRDHALTAPSLTASVIAPAPNAVRDQARTSPSLSQSVVQPAPTSVSRELSSAPVQMANAAVVPPPVSAPESARARRDPMMALPAPAVVAPPPSADASRDLHRLASGNMPDPSKAVVPPPSSQAGNGSFMSSVIGKIFGASEVVPPPPTVSEAGSSGNSHPTLQPNLVAPPPSVSSATTSGTPRGNRNGMGTALGSNVVAPPPTAGVSGGTGTRSLASSASPTLGVPNVVPPPPSVTGGGSGVGPGGAGTPSGTTLAANLVPPPPAIGGGNGATGAGQGRKGTGLGAPMDMGSPVAQPTAGASATNAGAVISTDPGSRVGLPTTGGTGSLSMSPSGGDKTGLGGAGGGTGIGRGDKAGSGVTGAGPGAGKTGTEHGSDANARGGISPTPGPGGAGNATSGNPPVPGVSVSGGSSIVNLGSFGDNPNAEPKAPDRSGVKKRPQQLNVTVVATANSGGAFEPYKNLLHGQKYTTYLDTGLGTVVMEFAEETPSHAYGSLTAPEKIRTDLPDGLPHARTVVKCTLDASGNVKNLHVLEAGSADVTAKLVAALRGWKFQPAMRGSDPVEVTAILGFNIDTSDRF